MGIREVEPEDLLSTLVVPCRLRDWHGMVLHCTVVPDQKDGEGRRVGRLIDQSHRHFRGFRFGMGYHILINVDGAVEIGERWINQLPGAHAVGLNHTHVGVAWVGDGDKELLTDAQWEALRRVWTVLSGRFRWKADVLRFHRDVTSAKTCPGKLLSKAIVLDHLLGVAHGEQQG